MGPLDEVVLAINEALEVSILSYYYTYAYKSLTCNDSPRSLVNRVTVNSKTSLTYAIYDLFL